MYVVIIMYGDIQRYTLNVYSGCETTLEVENVMMMQYKQQFVYSGKYGECLKQPNIRVFTETHTFSAEQTVWFLSWVLTQP